jgi:epoxyqueuosine reductase
LVNDFQARNNLDDISLLELFSWTEDYFLNTLQGSPIRRIGYQSWLRNISVALGNSPYHKDVEAALTEKLTSVSDMVAEHIQWALVQQKTKKLLSVQEAEKQQKNHRLTLRLIRSIEKGLSRDA